MRWCLVPRVQLTINAILAIIRSGSGWVRRVVKLTNFIGPGYVLAGNKLCACANSTGAKFHYDRAAARPKNLHGSVVSRRLFRSRDMDFDWMRFDKKYDDREGSLTFM